MSHPLQDCTMLIAHPDDEIIFGWPALPYAKRIVCASNDKHNPERQWCSRRGEALAEVGKMLGIEVVCFDYNSEFYRLPHRDGQLGELVRKLRDAITTPGPIFTHNSYGEYSNLDHVLVHLAARQDDYYVWCSDIRCEAGWFTPAEFDPGNLDQVYYECDLDTELAARVKAVYDDFGCWTWSFPIPNKANIYRAC